ncbi:Heavy metal-associated isoprenylated plant protein [Vigna angularis]|uniref:Heavy metal-associated isoprenylated plant protein n=1 Tax=Phaseolus angularis TaxID=3914 RepID=A0A8T0JW62_PHAAN|nr:Heavy metal-associated isoprenylated plant protein [Vigna angularis]
MANEEDYKKIEVKVSSNCCEGCKRKVNKALKNLEGVLSIEIDPSEPKITVFGNVNPHILIEKLQKVGKRAELCSYEEVEAEEKVSKKDEKQNTVWWEQEKQPHPCDIKIEKTKDVRTDKKKSSKDSNNNNNMNYNAYYHPQEMKKEENHHVPHHEVNFMAHSSMMNTHYSSIRTHPQCCYIAQPYAVAVPYYAIPSHSAPPLPQACAQHCHFEMPRFQTPFLRPTVQVGDYFSDENTMGCHVM